jgi:hypothetical protein
MAATVRTEGERSRKASTSAMVNFPVFRSGSATSRSTVRYATSQPTEYMKPS